ncbi:MAG: insulinase family protein [Chlorobi bacterium]|nr:insulinase family protein [Chlorobiota bacterium]
MKKQLLGLLMITGILASSCNTSKYRVIHKKDANGYSYEEVMNDPVHARIYTLDNGLKIYLTVNPDEPRLQTIIGVHAGSTSDPVSTTGLAHYFEHMMFKGTDKIGTTDWAKEKVFLQEISDLFEEHRNTTDPEAKKTIYHKIDSVSALAAKYAIPNEYDKLLSSIGAKGTNAMTSYDFTMFINDIPSNEVKKWAELESERFKHMVLRLFHTELETVYEEFNMYQDNDNSRANLVLFTALFPHHPYGRAVIGLPEHIKNPSMVNIYQFAHKYYVPNNMAIAMSGDLDFEKTIQIIDQYFGDMESKPVQPIEQPREEPVKGPVEKTVTGPSAASVMFAYRFGGDNSEDDKYVTLIDMILNNSKAGLIDLDLVQKQKVLAAGCGPYKLKDYTVHQFYGVPRQNQSLEEVRDLILAEIEKVKKGEFDDWLIQAVINDMRLSETRQRENNMSRASAFIDAYTKDIPWIDRVKYYDELEKITKDQLVEFAKNHYNDNYVIVYKRTGPNDQLVKVEKPEITPVPINRVAQSDFYKKFVAEKVTPLQPKFVDFKTAIKGSELPDGIHLDYIPNNTNDLFSLQYILDMGRENDLYLPLAVNYLPYLGTDEYSAADLQKEFFKLGVNLGVYASSKRTYISLTGLEKSLEPGLKLLEHVLSHVQPDTVAYKNYVRGIIKEREDAKLNKSSILWGGLFNYGQFGKNSPFTRILSEKELDETSPAKLTDLLKGLYGYKHYIFYYGQKDPSKVSPLLEKYHIVPSELKAYPEAASFTEQDNDKNKVYFVNYDMVQANIIMMSKDQPFDLSLKPAATLFNEYFGSGLSSIVFQEIRESKALAYTAFAAYFIPGRRDRSNFTYAFVGTQGDKLKTATDAMLSLMNKMPRAEKQFNLSKESIIKKIQTERITKTHIYSTFLTNKDMGVSEDIRKAVYEQVQKATLDDLQNFFDRHISGKNYTFLILGNKDALDMNVVKSLGEYHELSLKEIFNY